MATLITKNSSTASAVPAAGDLVKGELAVNVTDKKVYTKDNSAAVVKLVGSLGNQEANAVAVTGGTINGTTIGATTPSTGAFTTASASSGFTGNLTGNVTGNVSGTAANVTGVVAIANGGTGLSALGTGVQSALGQAVTGSGSFVLSTSPSLTTPNLGTPSAAVLTNATGLPLTTGVTGTLGVANGGTGITAFGTGVATALGQNVTGSGGIVLATSPSLTTPNLGTPSAATLTNATGLPISTGVSGLGTGVATALGVAVGSSGAFVVNGGVLGTPSSGTLTNATGLPLSTGVTGTLATTNGGTGLTSFTANGVVYASSTSALTTGSALTFDGTKLAILSSSAAVLESVKSTSTTNQSVQLQILNDNDTPLNIGVWGSSAGSFGILGASTPFITTNASTLNFANTNASGNIVWGIGSTPAEQMRLTSTGLGIGTSSPANKLHVYGGALTVNDEATYAARFGNNSTKGVVIGYDTANNVGHIGSVSPAVAWTDLVLNKNGGNLGLGVTPSAWRTAGGEKVIQFDTGSVYCNSSNQIYLNSNWYVNSSAQNIYIESGFATSYSQASGQHIWYTAPSWNGTGSDVISFTQAMTLDASGNLLVGDTTNPGGRFYMKGGYARFSDGTYTGLFGKGSDLVTGGGTADLAVRSDGAILFSYGSTERARITSGGDLLVGKTSADYTTVGCENRANGQINASTANTDNLNIYNSTAAAYRFYVSSAGTVHATNTTISAISDQRFKENIVDLDVGLNAVMALKPRKFDWKAGKGKDIKSDRGFIAQEFEQVFPDLIDEWKDPAPEGEEPYKSVRQDLIPVLVKAIQEQQAIITDLRARVAQLEAK